MQCWTCAGQRAEFAQGVVHWRPAVAGAAESVLWSLSVHTLWWSLHHALYCVVQVIPRAMSDGLADARRCCAGRSDARALMAKRAMVSATAKIKEKKVGWGVTLGGWGGIPSVEL